MQEDNLDKASANRDPITGALARTRWARESVPQQAASRAGAAAGTLAAGPLGTIVRRSHWCDCRRPRRQGDRRALRPTVEAGYWKDSYEREPYYQSGMTFDDYAPAYRLGGESRSRFADQSFDDVEEDLAGR
jgi:hypothetical protein